MISDRHSWWSSGNDDPHRNAASTDHFTMGSVGPRCSASRTASRFGSCQPLSGRFQPLQIEICPTNTGLVGPSEDLDTDSRSWRSRRFLRRLWSRRRAVGYCFRRSAPAPSSAGPWVGSGESEAPAFVASHEEDASAVLRHAVVGGVKHAPRARVAGLVPGVDLVDALQEPAHALVAAPVHEPVHVLDEECPRPRVGEDPQAGEERVGPRVLEPAVAAARPERRLRERLAGRAGYPHVRLAGLEPRRLEQRGRWQRVDVGLDYRPVRPVRAERGAGVGVDLDRDGGSEPRRPRTRSPGRRLRYTG